MSTPGNELVIQCTMRPVYRVDGKSYLTLWSACQRKAKRALIREYVIGRDDFGNYRWSYEMMQIQVGVDSFEPCKSQEEAESKRAYFNTERWAALKRVRAHHYFNEYKAGKP